MTKDMTINLSKLERDIIAVPTRNIQLIMKAYLPLLMFYEQCSPYYQSIASLHMIFCSGMLCLHNMQITWHNIQTT